MGDFDFVFEWFKEPKMEQVNMLIEKIDEALAPLRRQVHHRDQVDEVIARLFLHSIGANR